MSGQPNRYRSIARKVAREPLLHFLIAGALVLAASAIVGRLNKRAERIVVSAADLQQLRETWASQWGRPADAAQMRGLVDDFVREEVLYREAIASGFDQHDTIVRRRLAQKVEFLAQGAAAAVEPSDANLKQFFEQHPERYLVPAKVAFSHVYFSDTRQGAIAQAAATDALAGLTSGRTSAESARTLGDPFMLQSDYPPQTRDEVRSLFGADFAARLFAFQPEKWEGPIRSSYGAHLVRVSQATPGRTPALEEVRDRLTVDFKEQRVRAVTDAFYQKVRAKYRVDVDEEALATGQRHTTVAVPIGEPVDVDKSPLGAGR